MITGNFYYLKDSYYNKFPNCDLIGNNTKVVRIDDKLAKELNAIARKVLRFYFDKGIKIILTDLDFILKNL